jgi:hypothetical protein
VPGHDVLWIIAVPQQHPTFEHFDQTGAALHPALCKLLIPMCALGRIIIHLLEVKTVLVRIMCFLVLEITNIRLFQTRWYLADKNLKKNRGRA